MAYEFVIKHNGKRMSSGFCTDLWKSFYEDFKEKDLIKDSIYIDFKSTDEDDAKGYIEFPTKVYKEEDVKEFIKRLKEEVCDKKVNGSYYGFFYEAINKLAGEKLI